MACFHTTFVLAFQVKDWLGTVGSAAGDDTDGFVAAAGANLTVAVMFVFLCFGFYVLYRFCRKKRRFLLRAFRMNNRGHSLGTNALGPRRDSEEHEEAPSDSRISADRTEDMSSDPLLNEHENPNTMI